MYCIVPHCVVPYCIVPYCIVLYPNNTRLLVSIPTQSLWRLEEVPCRRGISSLAAATPQRRALAPPRRPEGAKSVAAGAAQVGAGAGWS